MATALSVLSGFPVVIQRDHEDSYLRVLIRDVVVLEGERVTAFDIYQLLTELGFNARVDNGIFGGKDDDQYDDCGAPLFVRV